MLTIRLIGTFRVDLDEQEVTVFQSKKVRGLLTYLAAEWDHSHARESMSGLLWPEYPNPSALTYLRNALSNLRHVTGDARADPHFFTVTHKTIQLNQNSSIWVDLRVFQEAVARPFDSGANLRDLQDAIALCRGPFLEGLASITGLAIYAAEAFIWS
ncbi:MAG: hypothetical protein IH586_12440, partial [Anaerolineaceae bacterium]|nr:hypothetical protein [Anaerolineaceae bacterium]